MLTENKKHLLISFSSSKFFPKGPETLQNGRSAELSTWNWSTGLSSTTEALKLKAMWRNLQRLKTRLSRSPCAASPSKQFQLVLSSAPTPPNIGPAGFFLSEGEIINEIGVKICGHDCPGKAEILCFPLTERKQEVINSKRKLLK